MENLQNNTPIKDFVDIYNANNFEIMQTISYLQDKIETLESEYGSFKTTCKNKLTSLEGEIRSMIPQVNDTIEQKFVEFYNYVGNDNQDNTQSTQPTETRPDTSQNTLAGYWVGTEIKIDNHSITKIAFNENLTKGGRAYFDNNDEKYADFALEISNNNIVLTFGGQYGGEGIPILGCSLIIFDYQVRTNYFRGSYKWENNTKNDFEYCRPNYQNLDGSWEITSSSIFYGKSINKMIFSDNMTKCTVYFSDNTQRDFLSEIDSRGYITLSIINNNNIITWIVLLVYPEYYRFSGAMGVGGWNIPGMPQSGIEGMRLNYYYTNK